MKVPGRFKKLVKDFSERLLSNRSDIKALVVIGSVAKGDYADDSDLDVVCVTEGKLDRDERQELIEMTPERVQLVLFSHGELDKHFENSTTMAHSIRKGIVIYDKDGFLKPYLECLLGLPSEKWMKDWFIHWLEFYFMGLVDSKREKPFHKEFCREECRCSISNNLARAAVNFSILYLETNGTVPISKGEIKKGMEGLVSHDILKGLETALEVCHEDRYMGYGDALEVKRTATWLKDRLIQGLSVSEPEMEGPVKMFNVLKAAGNKSSLSKKSGL